ncbi:MAG: alanine--tRNA ligase-related protein [Patescibacteria group bacterium]
MINREQIKRFFEHHGFVWREGASITSSNYKLLFNISGGVVYERIISGRERPEVSRVASVQTCLRTDGWNRIGHSGKHHLAFEMLGHFSFYEGNEADVKERMIGSAWRYLTECLGINQDTLFATVHPQDSTSQRIWSNLGVETSENACNTTYTPCKNRCGVRTEIVWRNPTTGNIVELWNLVFTEFQGQTLFEFPLDRIAADSGASIDRLVTAVEGKSSDYDNSNWVDIIGSIEAQSNAPDRILVCRLADMGKASVLLVEQGLRPGNKAAEYVLRRIIREAYLLCKQVQIPFEVFVKLASSRWCPTPAMSEVFVQEATRFDSALRRGMAEYRKTVLRAQGPLSHETIKQLSATFGLPEALIVVEESKRAIRGDHE